MHTYKFDFYKNGKTINVKLRFESFFEKDFDYVMKELDDYLKLY